MQSRIKRDKNKDLMDKNGRKKTNKLVQKSFINTKLRDNHHYI